MTSNEGARKLDLIDIYDCERVPELIKGMDNFLTIKGGGNILRGTEDTYSLPHMEQRFNNQTNRMDRFNRLQLEMQAKARLQKDTMETMGAVAAAIQ